MNPFPVEKIEERIKELTSSERLSDDLLFSSKLKAIFLDSPRRIGKSFLLMRVQIEASIENGKELYLFDHYNTDDMRHHEKTLVEVIEWYKSHNVFISYHWRPYRSGVKVGFTLENSYNEYMRIRIPDHNFNIQKETQFSKLLLII